VSESDPQQQPIKGPVPIIQKYSPLYRNIHTDGAFASVTLQAEIYIGFYSDKGRIADKLFIDMSPQGARYVDELMERLDGIDREIECGLYLPFTVAMGLRDLLDKRIKDVVETFGSPMEPDETK
jgi:hypothetical protein